VHPSGAPGEPAPPKREQSAPTVEELENFDLLITSGYFEDNGYQVGMRDVCLAWLQFREAEIELWIRSHRKSGLENLHESLHTLYGNLVDLYTKMDGLCGGSNSYLAVGGIAVNEEIQTELDEFVDIWDEMRPVLQRYLLFAKSFEEAYQQGKTADVDLPGLTPDELEKSLIGKLKLLQKAMTRLARGIRKLLMRGP
jgi:hypothetical protein